MHDTFITTYLTTTDLGDDNSLDQLDTYLRTQLSLPAEEPLTLAVQEVHR